MHKITKEKTIAFTGNRNLTSPDGTPQHELKAKLYNRLEELLESEYLNNGITTFISGMAVGWDMLCATVVVELKRKHPEIRLVAALPFIEQADKYSPSERAQYRHLIDNADFTIAIGGYTYTNQAYHDRNDFLIANSSKLIAYHNRRTKREQSSSLELPSKKEEGAANGKSRSGTASTIRKATDRGIEVVNLYEII